MKIKSNIRALRKVLGKTQGEFAAMVGVSKDAVASWETGRNPVSATLARQISLVTGADDRALTDNDRPLLTSNPNPERQPYSLEAYQKHRKMFWGESPAESVRRQIGPSLDALELLFTAAAHYGQGPEDTRLPGVLGAFNQWCKQTAVDFELEPGIDAQLMKRKRTEESTRSYGQWRALAKEQPEMARNWGFKDNRKKDDKEPLKLSMELFPVWAPGWNMRGGKR